MYLSNGAECNMYMRELDIFLLDRTANKIHSEKSRG